MKGFVWIFRERERWGGEGGGRREEVGGDRTEGGRECLHVHIDGCVCVRVSACVEVSECARYDCTFVHILCIYVFTSLVVNIKAFVNASLYGYTDLSRVLGDPFCSTYTE